MEVFDNYLRRLFLIKINVFGSCVSRVSLLNGDQSGHDIADDDLSLQYYFDK